MGSALSPRDGADKASDRPRQITIVLYLALVGSGIALFGLTANLLSAGSETVLEQARESGALDDISASEFVTRIRVIAGIGIALSAVAIAAAVSMAKRTPRARVVLTTTAAIAVAFSLWMGPIGVPWLFMCVTSIWLLWSRPSTAWLTGEAARPAAA